MNQLTRLVSPCIVLLLGAALSGCLFAVPLIEGFQDTGVTEGGRASQLKEDLRFFHHAIEDGNKATAVAYASDEFRDEFKTFLRKFSRSEKIVSAKVDFIDMADDAYSATVEVYVKYFTQKYYIVQERLIEEKWEFSLGEGWRLQSYSVLEENVQNG